MKSTILLTTAIFLVSAPSPDSKAVSEMTAGFISPANDPALLASMVAPEARINTDTGLVSTARIETSTSRRLAAHTESEEITLAD